VMGRLTLEVVAPVVTRVIDILAKKGKLQQKITVDQLLTQVRIIAPIAAGQQAQKVGNIVNWLQMMSMLAGPQAAMMAAKIEELFPALGRMMGVEERFIRDNASRDMLMSMVGKLQGAGQAAAMRPPQDEAPQMPGHQFVNGGAH
jgi:Bacteriophage head to tail connecting protein